MNFKRIQSIEEQIAPKRVLMIFGPRRVGKTTLLRNFIKDTSNKKIHYDIGDDLALRQLLGSQIRKDILDYASPYDIIAIDEAQQIPSIGLATKMMIDEFPEKQIILTGSSSFELAQQTGEPLTGRHFTLILLPISQQEILENNFYKKQHLSDFLIFGSYPEVLSQENQEEKIKVLKELVSSYLFKDILALDRIRSSDVLLDIAKSLAFQVGNEVSYNEIANLVKTDVKTVQRYIDVLEKAFVVKKIRAFSTNQRNEIAKQVKYYFYDNGARNAVIGNFNQLSNRNDVGALWENFIFTEFQKKNNFNNNPGNFYFWKSKTKKEIDIIIENSGKISAFECKFSDNYSENFKEFRKIYGDSENVVINKENYLDFLN